MKDNLQALLQERHAKVQEMRTMVDAAELRGGATADDQQAIDRIDSEISGVRDADGAVTKPGLDQRIANLRTLERLDNVTASEAAAAEEAASTGQRAQATSSVPGGEDEEYRDAFEAMIRGEASGDQLRALRRGYVNDEVRDQTKAVAAKGGYIAPDEFQRKLLLRVEEMSEARQVFKNVLRTANGNKLDFTAEDARGQAAWIDESGAFTATDDTFREIDIEAWKAGRLAKASIELVEDSFFDIQSYLANSIGTSIAVLEDAAFYQGDDNKKPNGAVEAYTVGVTAASATLITIDEILDLIYSVRPAYRKRGEFVVADLAVKALRKIKDADGRPIWQDGVAVGEPTTLYGYKVTTEVNLDAPAAGTKPVMFGDPSTYLIREVNGVNMVRLNERFIADEGKIGFLGWRRVDGDVLDDVGMKTLEMAAS